MIQNGIPFPAVALEIGIGLFMFFLAFRGLIRYRQKQSKVTLYLMFGLFCYAIAGFSAGIGKYLDYISDIPQSEFSYSSFTIATSYCLLIFANVFFTLLLTELFLKEEDQFPLIINILNFLFIGMIIPNISFGAGVYQSIAVYLMGFILVTTVLHLTLAINALKEVKSSDNVLTKVGLRLIATFSLMVILALILFILDLIFGVLQDSSYSIFYYLAWITVGLSTVVGFLGYIMPQWFRNLVGK